MSRMWWALGTLVVPALLAAPNAVADETHVRFEIGQPFRVAGRAYETGILAVHILSAYTPSTAMLELWVNGECLGLLPASRSVSDYPSTKAKALFTREDDGRLELTGFQLTGRPTGTTYRFP